MNYECEITIDLPRDKVIDLFDNPDNLPKWQPGLQSFEQISGDFGEPGAKSRLVYDENGRTIEMIETITVRDLPDELSFIYEAKGVHNVISNHFYAVGSEQTRWLLKTDFQFSGMMRLMALFMRGAFPKQTRKMMADFKAFAESD